VYLPRAEEAEIATERSHDRKPPAGGSETVLLVEDEQALRRLTRLLLERAGYRVFDAADPAAAEAIFRERGASIELLLTDVVMPGSSGPSLFARLSAERPALRVLYISGYTDDAVAHHAGLSPQAAFLQKPFTTAALMSKVREVLDR
jgi:two-component system, cell cycle sensor histidine kinase and response regulator CckA